MAASAKPNVAEKASEGDWRITAIGEDDGDGEDDEGELQLPGNDPNSRDGTLYCRR
jgi:hypothetical protein